jgi:hypothetical protein
MPDSGNPVDHIQVGDLVEYRQNTGGPLGRVPGKVLGIFDTNDGQTLADVEWSTLGPPRRLNISYLTKIQSV